MKVLHLINNLKREGAQVVVFNLVTASKQRDIEHIVCTRNPGDQLEKELRNNGITVYAPDRYYGMREISRSTDFIEQIINDNEVNIIHAHMADAAFIGWLVAKKQSLPLVITHHGHKITPRCNMVCRVIYLWLLRLAARYAAMNYVVSDSVKESVKNKLWVKRNKISVIVNGVPVTKGNILSKYIEINSNDVTLVAVGRFVALKGQQQLIQAMAGMKEHFNKIHAYLVGDGPMRQVLEQQIDEYGLANHVTLTGSVDTVAEYLDRADIYISCSRHEGLPVAALEAMTAGLPVIVTDVPGHRDIVQHGKTGLLFQPDDIEGLVNAINITLSDKDDTKKRVYNAYTMVRDKYSIDTSIRAYETGYVEICNTA